MKDFLNLKKILIPVIIPVLFRIGLYFCIIAGVYQIVQTASLFSGTILWQEILFIGIIWFVLYPIGLRIVCEVLIILSNMNDTLSDIKNQLKSQQDNNT